MATGIPLPGTMLDALLSGAKTGSGIYTGIMNPILQREKNKQVAEIDRAHQKQQAEQFAQDMALKKLTESRMGANSGLSREILQQQLLGLQHKNDPNYEFNQFKALQDMITSGGQGAQGGTTPAQQQAQMPPPTQEMGQGMGMFSPEGMQEAQQTPQQAPQSAPPEGGMNFDALKQNPMLRGFFKHKFGFDPLAAVPQTPEEKQADKIKLEEYKNEQKKALEQEKSNLKNEQLHQKTVESAKNDLPHLESTLEALENMKKIATNNPDLFGHSGVFGFGADKAAERFAKTTDNPNAGAWQTYGLAPIVAAESKMSSKGNQLALKQALANKANFSENQKVALSKIDASIKQIQKSIEENRKITGAKQLENKSETKNIGGRTFKKINGAWHEVL